MVVSNGRFEWSFRMVVSNEPKWGWLCHTASPFASRIFLSYDLRPTVAKKVRKVSEWLAASLEMKYRATGCGFESRAFRCFFPLKTLYV